MERRYDTVEAQRLLVRIITRLEYETLDLALNRIERDPKAHGRRDLKIHSANRVIVVTAYVSRPLKALYVLGFHLQRAQEPTKHQTETMKAYVAEIQKLERAAMSKAISRSKPSVQSIFDPRRKGNWMRREPAQAAPAWDLLEVKEHSLPEAPGGQPAGAEDESEAQPGGHGEEGEDRGGDVSRGSSNASRRRIRAWMCWRNWRRRWGVGFERLWARSEGGS